MCLRHLSRPASCFILNPAGHADLPGGRRQTIEIGIIGLGQSGKTTVFNALTRGHSPLASSPAGGKPNIGVAKVPDERLEWLAGIYAPERTVPADITYVDVPAATEGRGKREGIGGAVLNSLQRADALLHVVRAFADPSVPHVNGSVDPYRDIASMDLELTFSDLAIIERRLERLEAEMKGAKPAHRDLAHREQTLLDRLRSRLEEGTPVRAHGLQPEELGSLSGYQFLTAKPLVVALNIDEEQLPQASALERDLAARLDGPGLLGAVLCGKLEAELGRMDHQDEREFRESMGAGEAGSARIARASFRVLDIVPFFTVGADEVRAWTVPLHTPALKAAGKIHTDIERGFVRAEVVGFDNLSTSGSMAEAKKRGLLRVEGKTYPVQDGDVINFLFSI